MKSATSRIHKKLGGLETEKVLALIETAFTLTAERGPRAEDHIEWISRLLELYYDPLYRYGFETNVKSGREILFRGSLEECEKWILTESNSLRP
jgi:tRNA 2-selenouridine synthase